MTRSDIWRILQIPNFGVCVSLCTVTHSTPGFIQICHEPNESSLLRYVSLCVPWRNLPTDLFNGFIQISHRYNESQMVAVGVDHNSFKRVCVCVRVYVAPCHTTHMNMSCPTSEHVMSHIRISHVPYMEKSRSTYERVMSHVWTSHVPHVQEGASRTMLWRNCAGSLIWWPSILGAHFKIKKMRKKISKSYMKKKYWKKHYIHKYIHTWMRTYIRTNMQSEWLSDSMRL